MEQKVREFEALAKQMKIELKSVEKIRMKLSLA